MARMKKSTDRLISDVADAVREDLRAELMPLVSNLSDAVSDLEKALGGGGSTSTKKTSKRGPKKGARKGVKKTTRKKAGRKKSAKKTTTKRARGGKRLPRGAMEGAIRDALKSGSGAQSPADIRDKVMSKSMFSGRKKESLYPQIVQTLKRMDDVKKVGRGEYSMK